MKYLFFLQAFLLIISYGCVSNKSKTNKDEISGNDIFTIVSDCMFKADQGIDSQLGTVSCGNVLLNYDYGRFSYPGPITLEEDFANGFRGIFYVKFFDLIHIDQKVHRLFLDSVKVLDIRRPKPEDKLLFPCPNCNAIATVSFRNRIYQYPYTNNKSLWTMSDYEVTVDTILGYKRKLYMATNDSLPSGLFLSPVINPRQANKLSVVIHTKVDPVAARKLLMSIRLK